MQEIKCEFCHAPLIVKDGKTTLVLAYPIKETIKSADGDETHIRGVYVCLNCGHINVVGYPRPIAWLATRFLNFVAREPISKWGDDDHAETDDSF